MQENLETKKDNKGCKEGLIGCSTILFILIILGIIINFTFCGKNDKNKEEDMSATVITIAQKEVEKRLKSPKSAKFPWGYDEYNIKETVSDRDDCKRYSVSSYVDADNSFGAKIRVRYNATFDIKEDESYIVIECNLME